MTIKAKVLLTQVLVISVFLVIAGVIYGHFRQTAGVVRDVPEGLQDKVALMSHVTSVRSGLLQIESLLSSVAAEQKTEGDENKYAAQAELLSKQFMADVEKSKQLSTRIEHEGMRVLLEELAELFPGYYNARKKLAETYVQYGADDGNKLANDLNSETQHMMEATEMLVIYATQVVSTDAMRRENVLSELRVSLHETETAMKLLTSAGLIFVLLSVFFLGRTVSAQSAATEPAVYMPKDKELTSDDENLLGDLATELQDAREDLAKMQELEQAPLQESGGVSDAERQKAKEELVERFESRIQGIIQSVTTAAAELYQHADSMNSVISSTSTKADNVSHASSDMSNNVQNVASAAEEMSASVNEISHQISKSTEAVRLAVAAMEKADRTSQSLEEATQQIGKIVDFIQAIAGQINLLALNATIESARAGEAGKGFAVVAGEVKTLANQTTNATNDITSNISSIQEVSAQVIQSLQSIKHAIENVKNISSAISAAVEEQTAVTNEIAANMSHAAKGAEQINSNIGEVSQASSSASNAASQTLDAAKVLSKEAERLNKEVSSFLADAHDKEEA